MKIILATDGSSFSVAMVKDFSHWTLPLNTKVKIISVYEVDSLMNVASMGVLTEYYDDANMNSLQFAEKFVAAAAEIIKNKNPELAITTAVIAGVPKTVIVDEAEKFGADLIVLGSHGYGLVERLLLGSVSQSVVLHAKCSVEIVRKKTK